MRKLLYGNEKLHNYIDDVLAHTPNWQDHITVMRQFLTKVREANLTLRPTKCSIGFYRVPYVGHYIGTTHWNQKWNL